MSAVLRPAPSFERMTEADLPGVLEIERSIYPFPWTPGNFRDSLRAGYSCWVYRDGEDLIGYAVLMLASGEAHLLNLSIAVLRSAAGTGGSLLGDVVGVARRHGAQILFLEVRPSNTAGQRLYARHGFQQVGVRRNYYPAQRGREDALVLSLCRYEPRREIILAEMGLAPVWRLRGKTIGDSKSAAPAQAAAPSGNVAAPAKPAAPPRKSQIAAPLPGLAGTAKPDLADDRAARIARMDWPELKAAVGGCPACGLRKTCTQTVFGVGDEQADWLLVGEAPGAEEDARGEPFVGQAGRLLDNMLAGDRP